MRRIIQRVCHAVAIFMGSVALAAQAATITVNSTSDAAANDGLCTLREAIAAANNNTASGAAAGECAAGQALPTIDSIVFNISGGGQQTITPATDLPVISQAVTIDGLNGGVVGNRVQISGAGALSTGLNVSNADNVTISNLVVNGFTGRQIQLIFGNGGHLIQGNLLGTDPSGSTAVASSGNGIDVQLVSGTVTIGSGTVAGRNLIVSANGGTGVVTNGGSTVVQGNFIGTNVSGTNVLGNMGTGVSINNGSGTVGGVAAGAGNLIVAFTGVAFTGNPALGQSSGSARNNFIGTDITGTIALNLNNGAGVNIAHGVGVLVSGNLISGNGDGVVISSSGVSGAHSENNTVQNNRIGTAADGVTALGNSRDGVQVTGFGSFIGGANFGEGNIIAFNGQVGVDVQGNLSTTILGNSIFSNGQLGINLRGGTENAAGVTSNDANDVDTGANNLQNFPVLTAVQVNGANVDVSGTLNSTPNSIFRIEFFANTACDPSGNGEGRTFLGFTNVTTNGSGNATFASMIFPAAGGTVITTTATSNGGLFGGGAVVSPGGQPGGVVASIDTSEFSACLAAPVPVPPPTIAKSFGVASIVLNGSTTLSFTITNQASGNTALTGVAFTDTLPAGLVVATPNGLTGTCGSGAITATAGGGTVILSGGTLAAGGSCTFSVNVTGTTAGVKNNSVSVTSTEGGAGNTANASLAVITPPTIAKSFGAPTIPLGGTTTLTFTLANPDPVTTLNNVSFTDTLPAGLVVATPNGLAGICGAGTITAVPGSSTVSLSGVTGPPGANCTFSINVTGATAGVKNNSVTVTSTEATGNTATASVAVVAPPVIAKSFLPTSIALNGSSTLSFTISNPNAATALTGVAFIDTLPAGLVVATPNGLTGTCGGGTITATAGTGTVSLAGASLPAASQCTFSVSATGTTAGVKNNSVSVTSIEGGPGNTGTASVTVTTTLTISKTFGAASIPLNGTTSLTFLITNPNAALGLTGVAFTDTLPAGLVVATPNGLSGSCGSGTITATAASATVTLSGGTIAASGSCTFALNVTGTSAGVKSNSVTVSSAETGQGNTATASVTVLSPATIAKSFGASTVVPGGVTTLTFTLTNPNTAAALTGVGFTDVFPGGLIVSTPNGLTGSCGGGAITAVAGSATVGLAGASLAASGSCTFSVSVTATGSGQQNNVTTAVTSAEAGAGGTANATLTITAPLPSNIPTLSEWTLLLLGLVLALAAMFAMNRRSRMPS